MQGQLNPRQQQALCQRNAASNKESLKTLTGLPSSFKQTISQNRQSSRNLKDKSLSKTKLTLNSQLQSALTLKQTQRVGTSRFHHGHQPSFGGQPEKPEKVTSKSPKSSTISFYPAQDVRSQNKIHLNKAITQTLNQQKNPNRIRNSK